MALLKIKNLGKTFHTPMGEIAASISIPSLQLEQGEALLLDGPSGSGKTTVLHMISGLLSADSGSIYFAGEDVSKLPTAQRDVWRADNVGYIFQRLNLLDELNALENILLPQCWRKENNKQDLRQRALVLLEQVGLAQKAACFPGELSIGEQQRVAVVRALVHKPKLLLADEPTASLDLENGKVVLGLLRELCRENNVALLLSTHDEAVKATFAKKYNVRGGCYE
ncbi:ABC transporter ATP-binding protein [uncultured Phascolarctobacterium sp.]|uniref:ABC transporter ATP-binding protein n=1 Tax=uncultured Phascolarctobacterium sp. TaxID=512296 RepID=UPI0025DD6679|nr:ABC transporter ATP-binding protein [uncultured Phascolarctobacterium sp.]